MKILNFGSLNIDMVYSLTHFVKAGETVSSNNMHRFAGGKGLNQSIALARAGAEVYHAGSIGNDGVFLKEILNDAGVDTRFVREIDSPTGHAIIQVENSGQNCIIIYSGANYSVDEDFIETVFSDFGNGDWLLLQNEINCISKIIDCAYSKGMKIALNPSPMNSSVLECDLDKVSCFLVNEIEGAQISKKNNPKEICEYMNKKYPNAITVLTLGKEGAVCSFQGTQVEYPIVHTEVVDTTAAGDTFTGFFLGSLIQGVDKNEAMFMASCAASIAVSKMGAANSIPHLAEVKKLYNDLK